MATDPRLQTSVHSHMDEDDKTELEEYSPTVMDSLSVAPHEEEFAFHPLAEEEPSPLPTDPHAIHAALLDAMQRGDYPSAERLVHMLEEPQVVVSEIVLDVHEASDALALWRQRCSALPFYAQLRAPVPAYSIDAVGIWGENDTNVLRKQHTKMWEMYNPSILDNAYYSEMRFAVQQRRQAGFYVKCIPANATADYDLASNLVLARGSPNEVAELEEKFGVLHDHNCWWIICWKDSESGGFTRHAELNGELNVGTTRVNFPDRAGIDFDRELTVLFEYFKLDGRNRFGPPSFHGYAHEIGPEGHIKLFAGARPLAGGFSVIGGMAATPWVALKMEQSAVPKMCGFDALFYVMGNTLAPGRSSSAHKLHTAPFLG